MAGQTLGSGVSILRQVSSQFLKIANFSSARSSFTIMIDPNTKMDGRVSFMGLQQFGFWAPQTYLHHCFFCHHPTQKLAKNGTTGYCRWQKPTKNRRSKDNNKKNLPPVENVPGKVGSASKSKDQQDEPDGPNDNWFAQQILNSFEMAIKQNVWISHHVSMRSQHRTSYEPG